MIKYTKNEASTIRRAFDDLDYMLSTTFGGSVARQLGDARRATNGNADNATEGRAWALRAWLKGWDARPDYPARELCGLADWWMLGMLAGISAREQFDRGRTPGIRTDAHWQRWDDAVESVRRAAAAHEAAREREIGGIMGDRHV